MNIHLIHGRLVRDPEFTKGSEDKSNRCNFTVAVDRRYGDETDFFDCVIFGKRAEVIHKFFQKGSEILASGEGQIRSYDDKNGVRRKAYGITVSDFDFCGSPASGSNDQVSTQDEQVKLDEDIPF